MKKFILITATFVLAVSMLTACSKTDGNTDKTNEKQNVTDEKSKENTENTKSGETKSKEEKEPYEPFGKFVASDLEDNEVTQAVFADYDLTLIDIWGTSCGPCLMGMPDLKLIYDEYKDKGVNVIGLPLDILDPDGTVSETQIDLVKDIVKKTGADYTQIIASKDLYPVLFSVPATPTNVFVDKDGKMVGKVYNGISSKEEWMKIIDETLKEVKAEK